MARRRLGFAWVVVALALDLTSCVSPEELRREDEAACAGYGFHPGSDAFASCLQKERLARRYWSCATGSVLGLGLLGRGLGAVLAVTRGSVVSHFEIRVALDFIAVSVARRLLHRVRGSERTPFSHRFSLT